jgi:hypothetical protein
MGVLDALLEPLGRQKRTQGGSCLITGLEVAEAERKARERLARQALKGKAIKTVRDEEITVTDKVELLIVNTLRPITPLVSIIRKRSHSIMVD